MDKVKEYWNEYKLFIVCILLGLGVCIYFIGASFLKTKAPLSQPMQSQLDMSRSSDEGVKSTVRNQKTRAGEKSEEEEKGSSSILQVDVKGAVLHPGVYELQTGSRVTDAIRMAGGLLGNADRKSINLAQKLKDEAVIYVAIVGEEAPDVTHMQGDGSSKLEDSANGKEEKKGKLNLNKASESDLQEISGIGAKRAKDIVTYREEHGGFQSVDELKNVSGIGQKTLEKIKDALTVD